MPGDGYARVGVSVSRSGPLCSVAAVVIVLAGCATSSAPPPRGPEVFEVPYATVFGAAEDTLRAMGGRVLGSDERTGQLLAAFDQGPDYGDLELGVAITRPRGVAQGWEVRVSTLLPARADGSDSWLAEAEALEREFSDRLRSTLMLR
jgi:hypothetical protein